MTYLDSLSRHSASQVRTQRIVRQSLANAWKRIGSAIAVLSLGIASVVSAFTVDAQQALTVKQLMPPGHYLVLFQNNAEQRPSGGFLGSFATIDITETEYTNVYVDTNIYKRDNAFIKTHAIDPPEPLLGVAAENRWAMRDSNWDIDFRDAAARVSWFYQQEAGEPVDGVIAVNATVLQDLLELTGPISIPASDDTLTADNFFDTLHYKIEKEYFYDPQQRRLNEPKSVIRELIPVLQKALTRPAVLSRLIPLVMQELEERHIQLYHTDPAVESAILARGWGGALETPAGDFLHVNNASVGGRKSSLYIIQETSLEIDADQRTVTITRTHTGDGVWPDHTNNNYVRVVVPAGAQLHSAVRNTKRVTGDIDIDTTRGKTVFGIHLDTEPGSSSQLTIDYSVPTATNETVYYQKQSGILQEILQVSTDSGTVFDSLVTTDTQVSY